MADVICRKSENLDDWFVIELAEHPHKAGMMPSDGGFAMTWSGRISDADVEGTGAHMLAIADAIERGERASEKRCAVEPTSDGFDLWSPRNSRRRGRITKEEGARLATSIRAAIT